MDKNNSFVIIKPKPKQKSQGWKPVTIRTETWDRAQLICEQNGITMTSLITPAIEYALDRLIIEAE